MYGQQIRNAMGYGPLYGSHFLLNVNMQLPDDMK